MYVGAVLHLCLRVQSLIRTLTCTYGISSPAALHPSAVFLRLAAAEAIWSSKTAVIMSFRTEDASLSFWL